ncbi:MAG: hypothetical protein KDD50_05110, partial [Bdellovibrionales bacterium]|nr:hypothetical protein [Bdellovibrionales bacterium]
MDISHFEKIESYMPHNLDLLSFYGFSIAGITVFAFIIGRYFLMVTPFYFLFTKKHYDLKEKKKPKKKQIAFEIKYSIVSSLLFTLSALLIAILWKLGYTRIYLKINEYPVWYLFLSLFIYSLCHEIYFYWTHVWMHNPNIFKKI